MSKVVQENCIGKGNSMKKIITKNILVAGTHSYIGESFKTFMEQYPEKYIIKEIDTKGLKPTPGIFKGIDVIFCVAGIAHIKETNENRHLYFDINRDLVVSMARTAKMAGVKQFILLSSMSVYGLTTGHIKKNTKPHPVTAYGKSKLQADEAIQKLEDDNFIFTCLRPPMVYGKNCTGNYQTLRKFALNSPLFPDYKNQRSMIYIGNLCEFVKTVIDIERRGLFFPQNAEYTTTSEMVRQIAEENGKKIKMTKWFNGILKVIPIEIVKKVFGSLTYEPADTVNKYSFTVSIKLTEGE